MSYRKLLEVTHFHLFTMPVVLLIVGHLFLATGLGDRAKLAWLVAASAASPRTSRRRGWSATAAAGSRFCTRSRASR